MLSISPTSGHLDPLHVYESSHYLNFFAVIASSDHSSLEKLFSVVFCANSLCDSLLSAKFSSLLAYSWTNNWVLISQVLGPLPSTSVCSASCWPHFILWSLWHSSGWPLNPRCDPGGCRKLPWCLTDVLEVYLFIFCLKPGISPFAKSLWVILLENGIAVLYCGP